MPSLETMIKKPQEPVSTGQMILRMLYAFRIMQQQAAIEEMDYATL